MPANTPLRNYTYPTYLDPMDQFPAQIQELATDINNDMNGEAAGIAGARNQPSVRITATANQSITQNTNTTVVYTSGSVTYDNAGLANLAGNGLALTEQGVYVVQARLVMNAIGSGTTTPPVEISILSSAGFIPVIARKSQRAYALDEAWLSISGLHYVTGLVTDNITMTVRHQHTAAMTLTTRNLCAVKVSNLYGSD